MDIQFWHQRWRKNELGFHENEVNSKLAKYLAKLSLAENSRIFLPLCGKTLDIAWLLAGGYRVVGVELSEIAIVQLFADLGIIPTISAVGPLKHYNAKHIEIFVGDFFELSADQIGTLDATYDRAALVALPEEMRGGYAAHLVEITNKSPQLLVCFEYDQSLMAGPPFSINKEAIKQFYGNQYEITPIASTDVRGGLKGKCPANETAYILQ